MNPQPHPFVGQLGVLIFVLLIVYLSFTNKKRQFHFDDKFTIGYILDNDPIQTFSINTDTKTTRKKANKQIPSYLLTQEKTNPSINYDVNLMNDCLSSLVSLGTKKTQAKKITKDIFEKYNPKTIEDFIKFVFIK